MTHLRQLSLSLPWSCQGMRISSMQLTRNISRYTDTGRRCASIWSCSWHNWTFVVNSGGGRSSHSTLLTCWWRIVLVRKILDETRERHCEDEVWKGNRPKDKFSSPVSSEEGLELIVGRIFEFGWKVAAERNVPEAEDWDLFKVLRSTVASFAMDGAQLVVEMRWDRQTKQWTSVSAYYITRKYQHFIESALEGIPFASLTVRHASVESNLSFLRVSSTPKF